MTADSTHYDDLETRSADERTAALSSALPEQIDYARTNTPFYGRTLMDVDPAAITSREALAGLPVTRKSDLIARQAEDKPFGGLSAEQFSRVANVFMSPGPIFEPGGGITDYWRMGRAMWASGFRPGDLVYNTFAYHMTPAGHMMESGARAVGCAVFPAGVGNTELQVQAIMHLRPAAYVGTPSFLKILLEKAREQGVTDSLVAKASVGGEALPPSLRKELGALGVARVLQSYGTADLGLIAYESDAMEGLIADEGVIIEIVRPGTGEPVPDGEVGEVVVTTFNKTYPLIRFATGDLSAVMEGPSPCGRTNSRIKGWMGRADQTTKVKGMFVHPGQVADVARRHAEIGRARLVVTSRDNLDAMTLRCEVGEGKGDDALRAKIAESLQSACKVKGEVEFVAPGTLANDGKVIEDARSYE